MCEETNGYTQDVLACTHHHHYIIELSTGPFMTNTLSQLPYPLATVGS